MKPCRHETYIDTCRVCWLGRYDAEYHALYELPGPVEPIPGTAHFQYALNSPALRRGLGDDIAAVAYFVGAAWLVRRFERFLGIPCGCDRRRMSLNRFPSIRDILTGRWFRRR